MADRPFESFARTRPVDHKKPRGQGETCEKCGLIVRPGDWPFCKPGHPELHLR